MPQAQMTDPAQRTYASNRFELQLNGVESGLIYSIDGGHFKSEPIGEQVGGDNQVTRFPGRQKFEEITFQVGASMAPDFWKWIADSIANKPSRRSGAIVVRDFDNRERGRREFYDALISEIQFPALDATSKTPKLLTIKISPERIAYKPGDGGAPQRSQNLDMSRQKRYLPTNFRMAIDGVGTDLTRRALKIDAISVKQKIIDAPCGGLLYTPREPGRIEFPTISFQIAEAHAGPWIKWWEEYVGQGEHVAENEHSGSITYMDSSRAKDLFTLHLHNIGITGLTFDKLDGQSDGIRTVKVDLFVESLSLEA